MALLSSNRVMAIPTGTRIEFELVSALKSIKVMAVGPKAMKHSVVPFVSTVGGYEKAVFGAGLLGWKYVRKQYRPLTVGIKTGEVAFAILLFDV